MNLCTAVDIWKLGRQISKVEATFPSCMHSGFTPNVLHAVNTLSIL